MKKQQALAVFWDMDGTLIDTEELHYAVIRDWCDGYGFTLTPEANAELFGKTMQEKWQVLSPKLARESSPEVFRKECEEDYISRLDPSMGMERSLKIVREVARRGIVQACVSNGEANVVRANVALLGLTDIFSIIISGEDVEKGKPAPDPYLAAAAAANLSPEKCIAVEDSLVGLRSAREAGCIVCGWPLDPNAKIDCDYLLTKTEDFPMELLG